MNLAKQQVKALLDVMSADDARPGIAQSWVELLNDEPHLVTTDSYQAVCFKLPATFSDRAGEVITRAELLKFYKLMERKDQLTTEQVETMLQPAENRPPEFKMIVEKLPKEGNTEQISFNAKYALNLEKVAGQPLVYRMTGKLNPLVAETAGDLFILMPMKI